MEGTCKLCLRENVELQKSHYLPAGVYRILRDGGAPNPNPWMITRTGEVQTSAQLKRYLLCSECEERLNKNGERWVLDHCLKQNGTFPLATILAVREPDVSSPRNHTKIFHAARVSEINVSALSYFAASIFWRGSIYPWDDNGAYPVRLGPFAESFRKYLIGEAGFPQESALFTVVREGNESVSLTFPPVGLKIETLHYYNFSMPGVAFSLFVSKNIPQKFRSMCLVRGEGHPIMVTSALENALFTTVKRIQEQAQAHRRKKRPKD